MILWTNSISNRIQKSVRKTGIFCFQYYQVFVIREFLDHHGLLRKTLSTKPWSCWRDMSVNWFLVLIKMKMTWFTCVKALELLRLKYKIDFFISYLSTSGKGGARVQQSPWWNATNYCVFKPEKSIFMKNRHSKTKIQAIFTIFQDNIIRGGKGSIEKGLIRKFLTSKQ